MIKALIFDFDGLIVDTETASYYAYRDILREQFSVELPLTVWAQCIGTTFDAFHPLDYLEEQLAHNVNRTQVTNDVNEHFKALIASEQLRPGVKQYLQEARQLGLKVALASSSDIAWIQPYLDQFELTDYFDSLSTADDVAAVKPDPELYLHALKQLQLSPSEAIAFEDSVHGSDAAKAAGIYCVIVPNSVTASLPFKSFDLKISSMAETPLQEIMKQATAKR